MISPYSLQRTTPPETQGATWGYGLVGDYLEQFGSLQLVNGASSSAATYLVLSASNSDVVFRNSSTSEVSLYGQVVYYVSTQNGAAFLGLYNLSATDRRSSDSHWPGH